MVRDPRTFGNLNSVLRNVFDNSNIAWAFGQWNLLPDSIQSLIGPSHYDIKPCFDVWKTHWPSLQGLSIGGDERKLVGASAWNFGKSGLLGLEGGQDPLAEILSRNERRTVVSGAS
jgi:hypothetical protein